MVYHLNLLSEPSFYFGILAVILPAMLYWAITRRPRHRPNIIINPNYGERTRVKIRVINIHRDRGSYHDHFIVTFTIDNGTRKYRAETGTDSFLAQYKKPSNVDMVGNRKTPLIRYLELFDIKTIVIRKTLTFLPGMSKDDIEVVWVDKTGQEINWGYQVG